METSISHVLNYLNLSDLNLISIWTMGRRVRRVYLEHLGVAIDSKILTVVNTIISDFLCVSEKV